MFLRVFTFKAGRRAPLAYDLQLSLQRFEVQFAGDLVRGRFWLDSLVVDGAAEKEKLVPGKLPEEEKAQLQALLDQEIRRLGESPVATLEGKIVDYTLIAALEMNGRRGKESRFTMTWLGKEVWGVKKIVPSEWGIPTFTDPILPFSLQDRVVVRYAVLPMPWR